MRYERILMAGAVALPEGYEHGTYRAYRNCKCRCIPCRGANAEQSRKGRHHGRVDKRRQRAAQRAMRKLRDRHEAEYADLLEVELELIADEENEVARQRAETAQCGCRIDPSGCVVHRPKSSASGP